MLSQAGNIISTIVIALCVLSLLLGEGMLVAIGVLLAVIAYRLFVIAQQQQQQTELLILIAEGDD